MNEENIHPDQAAEEPANEMPPAPISADAVKKKGWQMPEPKFQQTSGYLPQGYLDEINQAGGFSPKPGVSSVEPAAGAKAPEKLPDNFDDIPPPSEMPAINEDAEAADLTMYNVSMPFNAAETVADETAADEIAAVEDLLEPMPEPEPVPDVEPQPEIIEPIVENSGISIAPVAAEKKSGIVSTLLFLLFFIGLGVLALIIIAIAYYLFLAEPSAGRTF